MKLRRMALVAVNLLIGIICGTAAVAQSSCDLLLQHGITNIAKYQSAEHAIAYKWHSYCGIDFNSASDSAVSRASASIFGFGSGAGGYNSSQQRTRLKAWCDDNEAFASSKSDLYEEAQTLSVPALSAWNQCIDMSRKDIKIKFTPNGEHSQFIHFEVDSTHDGTLKYFGVRSQNYTCEESMVANNNAVDVAAQPDITNSNIQIDCTRSDPDVAETDGVGRMTYEAGFISINTSGPSLAIAFPQVVSDYYVTPPGSVMAFDATSCPAGWNDYAPAYGRFIRGIDKSGQNQDAGGLRAAGSLQDDQTGDHGHQYSRITGFFGRNYVGDGMGWANVPKSGTATRHSGEGGDGSNKYHSGVRSAFEATEPQEAALENRPKNVALLYCKKMVGN